MINDLNYAALEKAKVAQLDFIVTLARHPVVEAIYLYGSRARGDFMEKSDIDLAINCPHASSIDWQELLDIVDAAQTLLHIDILRLDRSGPEILRKIDQDKVCLYKDRSCQKGI